MRAGYKQTKLGEIPEDWEVVKIEDIAQVKGGKRLPKGEALQEKRTNHPYIRVSDMYMGGVDLENILYVPEHIFPMISRYTISKDDLFISVAGTLGITGQIPIELDGANLTENADKITKIKMDRFFLLQILFSPLIQDAVEREKTNNAQPKLALSRIRSFLVPKPPKTEQQEIAHILSTVDEKIDLIAQQISETQALKKGLMQRLLTRGIGHTEFKDSPLGEIPMGWEVVKLGEVGGLSGGYAFKSKEFNDQGIGYQVIRMGNVQSNGLELDKNPMFLECISKKEEKFLLKDGNVLITLTGTIGKTDYGNVAYIEKSNSMLLNQRVGRFDYNSNLIGKFLYFLFCSEDFRKQFFERGKGGTGNQANVGKQGFESIKVILPTLDEQIKIAQILSTVDNKLQVLSSKKTEYQTLKKGLMQQLLTGKIRVKTH